MRMAQNMTHFLPPLGWFGRIRVEKEGEHRGQLDIKKAGIFAITDGVRALALEAGRLDGSTHDRIEALTAAGMLTPREAADLAASFDFLVLLRLRGQIDALRQGRAPDNFVALDRLNALEQGELKLALECVARFQDFIKQHFRLNLLGS
jgi:CBS domain-containing protein